MATLILYAATLSGFAFPYFLIKATEDKDDIIAKLMACICFGLIVIALLDK